MSLYGYNTKKDLTSMGSFMLMGVFGVFIASIVNLFLQSSSVSFAISIISVISFTGLTAWDVKVLKNYYLQADDEEDRKKAAVVGSLNIYMNFINIFLSLLRLFGDRKN
jgi:FtsH-binding integral membrane protein